MPRSSLYDADFMTAILPTVWSQTGLFSSTAGLFFFMAWRACQSNAAMHSTNTSLNSALHIIFLLHIHISLIKVTYFLNHLKTQVVRWFVQTQGKDLED